MPKRRMYRHAVTQPLDTSYRLIPLTKGQNAIVDTDDFEWLDQWNWRAFWNKGTRSFYAYRSLTPVNRKNKNLSMHRQILGCSPDEEGDHKNHDTLDNRRDNLRKCTHAQNNQNGRLRCDNQTGFRGVSVWEGKFLAFISVGSRQVNLGSFESPEEAAHAYDDAAKKLHGEFAHLNFTSSQE